MMVMCRRGMWVWVNGGREAVSGQSGFGEPSTFQERRGLRGMLQGQVSRQEHMLEEGRDHHCNRRVPRLLQWRPLRPQWCSFWSHGHFRRGWSAQEPRKALSPLQTVRVSTLMYYFSGFSILSSYNYNLVRKMKNPLFFYRLVKFGLKKNGICLC